MEKCLKPRSVSVIHQPVSMLLPSLHIDFGLGYGGVFYDVAKMKFMLKTLKYAMILMHDVDDYDVDGNF